MIANVKKTAFGRVSHNTAQESSKRKTKMRKIPASYLAGQDIRSEDDNFWNN